MTKQWYHKNKCSEILLIWLQSTLISRLRLLCFCSVLGPCLLEMAVRSPGIGTAGWDSAWGKWNHGSSNGANCCCRGLGSRESTVAAWKQRSFGQLTYKGTICATHSALANPPLHKSAYGATGSLKPKEVQSKHRNTAWLSQSEGDSEMSDSPLRTDSAKIHWMHFISPPYYIHKEPYSNIA